MKKRVTALVLVALLICTFTAGCKQETATSSEPAAQPGQSSEPNGTVSVSEDSNIVIVMDSDLVTLYPINTANTMDGGIERLIMDGLVGFTDDYKLVWLLASGYEANAESTEYTFFLRKGISFTDGTPWNAEAAKTNIDIMSDASYGYKKNSNYSMIDHTDVVDEYTIKITLNKPFGAFLNTLAHPSAVMVSPAQIAKGADACSSEPIGTGQYKLKEWRPAEQWVLELNRDWWGYDAEICGGKALVAENAGFNTITFKPVTEAATRVAIMLGQEGDMLNGVNSTTIQTLKDAGLTVDRSPSLSLTYFYMNNKKEHLSNIKVRQAVAMAIDIDSMLQVIDHGYADRPTSFICPAVSYFSPQEIIYKFDVNAAKALLAEAGYPNGFTINCWCQNSTGGIQRAEFIQQQLAQIGITLKIIPNESGTLSSGVNGYSGDPKDTEWDTYIRGFSPSTGDADQGLGRFSSPMFTPVGTNFSFYENEEYDKCIADGAASPNPEVRAAAYAKAQEIIWKDVPAIPLIFSSNSWAYNKKLQNVSNYADGTVYLRDAVYVP